jgi:hypothetical protein
MRGTKPAAPSLSFAPPAVVAHGSRSRSDHFSSSPLGNPRRQVTGGLGFSRRGRNFPRVHFCPRTRGLMRVSPADETGTPERRRSAGRAATKAANVSGTFHRNVRWGCQPHSDSVARCWKLFAARRNNPENPNGPNRRPQEESESQGRATDGSPHVEERLRATANRRPSFAASTANPHSPVNIVAKLCRTAGPESLRAQSIVEAESVSEPNCEFRRSETLPPSELQCLPHQDRLRRVLKRKMVAHRRPPPSQSGHWLPTASI